MTPALWTVALAAAVLWPGRALSAFDGMPLDGRTEAVLIGVVVPALCWAHRTFLDRWPVRLIILALLTLKLAGAMVLTQHGLCARFSTAAPFNAHVLTIPIEEPNGFLRSWDVRADWRAGTPACTAIVDRAYATASAFPAWFVNITDAVGSGRRDLALDISGYVRVPQSGAFTIDLDRDMTASGHIDSQPVSSTGGQTIAVSLDAGTHAIVLRTQLTGDRWKFIPRWNDQDAFRTTMLTVSEPSGRDRWLATPMTVATGALIVTLLAWWSMSFVAAYRASPLLITWCVVASAALAAAGAVGHLERLA